MKTNKTFAIAVVLLINITFVLLVTLKKSPDAPAEDVSGREALLNAMNEAYHGGFEKLSGAETQIEMTMAASDLYASVKPYLAKAAEYRLNRLKTPEERQAFLLKLFDTGDAVRRIFDVDSGGSASSMTQLMSAASLLMSRASVWLMEDDAYEDWMRWTDLAFELDGQTIRMKDGTGTFLSKPYDEYVELNLSFEPGNRFSCNGKDYVIVTEDLEGSLSTDYLRLHLCRLDPPSAGPADKDGSSPDTDDADDADGDDSFKPLGILRPVRLLDTFLMRDFKVEGNKLVLYGEKTHSGGPYEATVELPE